MKIVFDTNTLISATLFPNSVTGKCVYHYREHFTSLASQETINEFSRVIHYRKFDKYLTQEERIKAIKFVVETSMLIDIKSQVYDCTDPDDNKFLELALDGCADLIISGDNDLLTLHPFRNIPIVSAGEFLKLLSSKLK